MRDPDTLCADLDHEFNAILSYLHSCGDKKKPDYRYIKSLLTEIKNRNNFQDKLEWYNPDLNTG